MIRDLEEHLYQPAGSLAWNFQPGYCTVRAINEDGETRRTWRAIYWYGRCDSACDVFGDPDSDDDEGYAGQLIIRAGNPVTIGFSNQHRRLEWVQVHYQCGKLWQRTGPDDVYRLIWDQSWQDRAGRGQEGPFGLTFGQPYDAWDSLIRAAQEQTASLLEAMKSAGASEREAAVLLMNMNGEYRGPDDFA